MTDTPKDESAFCTLGDFAGAAPKVSMAIGLLARIFAETQQRFAVPDDVARCVHQALLVEKLACVADPAQRTAMVRMLTANLAAMVDMAVEQKLRQAARAAALAEEAGRRQAVADAALALRRTADADLDCQSTAAEAAGAAPIGALH